MESVRTIDPVGRGSSADFGIARTVGFAQTPSLKLFPELTTVQKLSLIQLSFLFCRDQVSASVGQQDAQVADIISRRASDDGVIDSLKQREAVELCC